jgi:hypothetical protein
MQACRNTGLAGPAGGQQRRCRLADQVVNGLVLKEYRPGAAGKHSSRQWAFASRSGDASGPNA